jgi:hypothetical protein
MGFKEFAETTAFRQVARIVTALSTQDERIADEFRAIRRGRIPSGKIVEISGDVPVGMHMSLGQFAEAISTRIWESVGRANFRTFEDARAYVHKLGLQSNGDWRAYCGSGEKPEDIPSNPQIVYADVGWEGFGDWLGTGRRRGNWRPFEQARAYVHKLGLKSIAQWEAYCNSGKKPDDIPEVPRGRYAGDGWIGIADWLGTGASRHRIGGWRSFEEARTYVRKLGLESTADWKTYCRSGKKPDDIPVSPRKVYARAGWEGLDDWLGIAKHWRPFREARIFARKIGLNSKTEWDAYCRSGKKPNDIPNAPHRVYADWNGWGDWLGTGRRAPVKKCRPFKQARAYARGLNLESARDWYAYCQSSKKPDDIPTHPDSVYADAGWDGYGDWLGTGRRRVGWRSFAKARAFARSLGLKTQVDWYAYCRSGKKPDDIPARPDNVYPQQWRDTADWLGTIP